VSAAKSPSVDPVVTVISVTGSYRRPYSCAIFADTASRNASTPGIGAYWLWPARMCRATASTISAGGLNSGNPCERLMAPHSLASFVITAKMLTPLEGSLERNVLGTPQF
jgi:hypothetical protein